MDWSFASGCTHGCTHGCTLPRLSATQLRSATDRPVFPSDRDFHQDFHPTVGAYSQAHSSTAFRALAPAASFRGAQSYRFAFGPINMAHHIFQLESELQNIPEAAPSSPSFSVSEKLARYGSTALSAVEHLTLLVGKESIALALMRHFGSLNVPGIAAIPSTTEGGGCYCRIEHICNRGKRACAFLTSSITRNQSIMPAPI
jgi:hypothetical protein